jgi:hypothetical protein
VLEPGGDAGFLPFCLVFSAGCVLAGASMIGSA